jgi:hypothetical protein
MNRTRGIAMLWLCAVAASGCNGDGREAGDDPTRSDEGPTAGRPATDPGENRQPRDASGVPDTRANTRDSAAASPGETRGTLDGPSDETTVPDR